MELASLQQLAVEVQGELSLERVLAAVTTGLAGQANIALARIWLLERGDICDVCPMREECPNQTWCLHLAASDGHDVKRAEHWTGLNGEFRRFPLGVRKVGRIGATGDPILFSNSDGDMSWARHPSWVSSEKIQSFAGQPLIFRGEVMGVLAVFSRTQVTEDGMTVLRVFADHAAAAIANARAFDEIGKLSAKLELENEYLREEVKGANRHGEIVGESSALRKILEQIALVAPTDSTVLVQGESGTGKELIAQAIHENSARAERALIKVNCASIPRELFESEFFGHVRGSFTGAIRDRVGRFQLADGGTIFLDEIGEIPLDLQSKLLRVLQENEFERLGEERTREVDVRIVAATNRDLRAEVDAGRFRRDLYYRLSVFPVEVPPLRERLEDVPLIAERLLKEKCQELGVQQLRLKQRHVIELQQYDWPGNVRELQNVIERATITSSNGVLEFDLPSKPKTRRNVPAPPESERILTQVELETLERENIIRALEQADWKVSGQNGAADLLGIKPTTLASRIRVMNIEKPRR